jgi:acetyltransferase AlgX (SGNH hydrolase-like protein)
MRTGQNTFYRSGGASLWLFIASAWWAGTAWAARQPQLSLIGLTNDLFILGLLWSYIAGWSLALSRARDPRGTMFRATAITLAIVGGLLMLEVPAAGDLLDYRRIREAFTGPQGPDVGFVDDRELIFRRTPNARWTGRPRTDMASYFNLSFRAAQPLTFSTDNRGFRNLSTPDRVDIALVGDSYIEGISVSDEDTAAVRLHALTGLTVANLGVAGYGTLQELTILKRYAMPLHPKLVAWFFFEGNDLDDDQSFESARLADDQPASANSAPVVHPPAWSRWRSFVDRSFTRNAWLQMRQMTDWLVPNGLDTFGWFREHGGQLEKIHFFDFYATRPFTDYERQRLEVTRATFRQALEICREQGMRLVVFYIPIKFRVYGDFCTFPQGSPCVTWHPWDLESRLAAVLRDAGIEFVSLTEPMRAAARMGDLLYLRDDSHWNAAGQAFVAEQLTAVWASSDTSRRHTIPSSDGR